MDVVIPHCFAYTTKWLSLGTDPELFEVCPMRHIPGFCLIINSMSLCMVWAELSNCLFCFGTRSRAFTGQHNGSLITGPAPKRLASEGTITAVEMCLAVTLVMSFVSNYGGVNFGVVEIPSPSWKTLLLVMLPLLTFASLLGAHYFLRAFCHCIMHVRRTYFDSVFS